MRETLYPVDFFNPQDLSLMEQGEAAPLIDVASPNVDVPDLSVSSGAADLPTCERSTGCTSPQYCTKKCAAQFMKAAGVTIEG